MHKIPWWWMAILVTACGGTSPETTDLPGNAPGPDTFRDTAADLPSDGPCVPGPLSVPVPGTWAQVQVREAIVNSPSLQDVHRTYTTLSLWEISVEGSALAVRSTACAVESDSPESPVKTVIPLALVQSIPPQDLSVAIEAQGNGRRLVQDRHVEVRGAVLAHPDTDPLPTDPEDPAVVDQDRDGHPGVTVLLTGLMDGAVYVVQRIWTQLEGCSTASGEFVGEVLWGEDQVVLGSDNPVLVMQSVITPVPGAGRFRMRPVPPGSDCDYLRNHRQEVFGE